MHYDYLVMGAGLFGAAYAQRMYEAGKSVLVIEKRNHIGGNVYTEEVADIQVLRYGTHIFHTDSKKAWDCVNRFAEFNRYTSSTIANYHGQLFSLPAAPDWHDGGGGWCTAVVHGRDGHLQHLRECTGQRH